MARPKNADKKKESLENIGVKVDPLLKRAIEDESGSLRIAAGTYTRQLVELGWQIRHELPIAKNPREQILLSWFNELPIGEQENVMAMVEALHKKHGQKTSGKRFELVDSDKAQPKEDHRPEEYEDLN
jgi:hypothetical protein